MAIGRVKKEADNLLKKELISSVRRRFNNSVHFSSLRDFHLWVAIPAVSLSLLACAHIDSEQAADFEKTVNTAGTNFATAINNVQAVQVDRKLDTMSEQATGKEPNPDDLTPDLTEGIKSHLISRFNLLVQYAADLSKLSAGQSSFATGVSGLNGAASKDLTDTTDLTSSLGNGAILTAPEAKQMQSDISTFSGAVAVLGEAIINAYSQSKAYDVASKYDGEVAIYCADLQTIIAFDPDHPNNRGLCAVSHWAYEDREVALWKLLHDTNPDTPEHVAQRRVWLSEYDTLCISQAKDHAMLVSLRMALGKIAQAHHALVTKQDTSFFAEIRDAYATINGYVTDYKTGSSTNAKPATSTSSSPTTSTSIPSSTN